MALNPIHRHFTPALSASAAILIGLGLVAASAPAKDPEAATGGRRPVPVATPTGEAQSCIPLTRIRNTRVHNDKVIDFEMRGGQVYRNELPFNCPGLSFNEAFSYQTSITQLCSQDIITVINQGPMVRGASCGLGKFQPVTIARKPKLPKHAD